MYLIPVFASILAIIFLGESLSLFHLMGGLLILTGLILATRSRRRRPKPITPYDKGDERA
jgi:drug/metabolite transporter (DMT)-like permease